MDTIKKTILFLIGCIGFRLGIAYFAKIATIPYLRIMGYLALLPAFGFFYLFFTGARKKGAFSDHIWWGNVRPIHGVLYGLFAYHAIQGDKTAWIYLLLDAIVGLVAFLHQRQILKIDRVPM